MALITWQKRDPKGAKTGPVKYLDFDATLVEEFSRAADVTQYPVENGAVLSDHYQPQPRALTLEVQVSDTPAQIPNRIDGKTNAAPAPGARERPKHLDLPVHREPVTSITSTRILTANAARFPTKRTASVLQFDGVVHRSVDVFVVLDELMETGQLVDVLFFGDVDRKDFVITNVRAPRDASSGSTLNFTIDLLQITFADTKTEGNAEPTDAKHKPKNDAGNRSGSNTDSDAIAYSKANSATRWP